MAVLAEGKMKATATVTLFLTFFIAVGCSSADFRERLIALKPHEHAIGIPVDVKEILFDVDNKTIDNKLFEHACKATPLMMALGSTFGTCSSSSTCIGIGQQLKVMARGVMDFGPTKPELGKKVTILGKVQGRRRRRQVGIFGIGAIKIGDHNEVSIFTDDEEEANKFGDKFGEYVVIHGEVTRLFPETDHPYRGVIVTSIFMVSLDPTIFDPTTTIMVSPVMKASPGETAGRSSIMAGIFSLTAFLAAAVALISWTLQKKRKAWNKKT